ncbi:uncharacterized protein TNCV_4894671 [Trichonephila clavipes]|nr:uncharacterized protein TNCV_4894671 [Trichonephila clavipes]
MEIRTGSSDSNSSHHESSSFENVQRSSKESQFGRKKGSGEKHELEGKGISFFKKDQGYKRSHDSGSGGLQRKIQKGSDHTVPKRALSSNYTNSVLPKYRKRGRTEETVMPNTSGYKLRPKNGRRVESRPTMKRKTQQGGPVRARNSKGKHYSPYI